MSEETRGVFVPENEWGIIKGYVSNMAQVGGQPWEALKFAKEVIMINVVDRDNVPNPIPVVIAPEVTPQEITETFDRAINSAVNWGGAIVRLGMQAKLLDAFRPIIPSAEKGLIGYYVDYIIADMATFLAAEGSFDFFDYQNTYGPNPIQGMLARAQGLFLRDEELGLYQCSNGHPVEWKPKEDQSLLSAYVWMCETCKYPYVVSEVTRIDPSDPRADPSTHADVRPTQLPDSIKDQ